MVGCFGRCLSSSGLVPPNHLELERDELKHLFNKSLQFNKGRLIVHGIFARADTRNNNGRVYPKHILKREVAKFEAGHIVKGTALGELDHPNYASRYFKCLNLPNTSHQVLEVQWKGDCLWGTIEILTTPSGLLLWELYSQGIRVGVSSRGWASLRTDNKQKCVFVDDDFELITFDFVTEPSTKDAFLVPVRVPYKRRVPDQQKFVQMAHLGHGVVSMRNVARMPDVGALVKRLNELQSISGTSSAKQQISLREKATGLDKLLLFSHYLVFPDAEYLDVEEHARDYRAHISMFAMHAHLADKQHLAKRSDLNTIILQEITKHSFPSGDAGRQDHVDSHDWPSSSNHKLTDMGHSHSVAVAAGMPQRAMMSECQPQQQQQHMDLRGRASSGSCSGNRVYPEPPQSSTWMESAPCTSYPAGAPTLASASMRHSSCRQPSQQPSQAPPPGINSSAVHELQLIRGTLQRYAETYISQQGALQALLKVNLPAQQIVPARQASSW